MCGDPSSEESMLCGGTTDNGNVTGGRNARGDSNTLDAVVQANALGAEVAQALHTQLPAPSATLPNPVCKY